MATVKFIGPVQVVTEYPFRCIFDLEGNGEKFKGALVGHLGERISKTFREGDILELRGHWISEKTFGELFIIEHTTLPFSSGRLVNAYV